MKKLLAAVSLMAFFLLSGCSTVEGVGKDLKSLGGSIEKEAQEERAN